MRAVETSAYQICTHPLPPSQIEHFETHRVVWLPSEMCEPLISYVPQPWATNSPGHEDRWWWRQQTTR
jgi:hypothetical protein